MIRSILVALKPDGSQQSLIEFATNLSARYQWELVGVSVIDVDRLAPAEAVPIGATTAKVHRDEQRTAAARRTAIQVTHDLESRCQALSLRCTAHVREGDTARLLALEAQSVDAVLCAHKAGSDTSERSLLHSILKHNCRPAIVASPNASLNDRVLLAYDGSVQAARAMASFAHSGLAENRDIHVLSIHQDLEQASTLAHSAAEFLKRHGISVEPRARQLSHDIAKQILEEASNVGAGLIVMGAFGRSSVREFFFGSVTSGILSNLPMPLFIDH